MNPTLLTGGNVSASGPSMRPERAADRTGKASSADDQAAGPGVFAGMLSAHCAAGADSQAAADQAASASPDGSVGTNVNANANAAASTDEAASTTAPLGDDVMQAVQATSPTLAHWLMQMAGMMQPVSPAQTAPAGVPGLPDGAVAAAKTGSAANAANAKAGGDWPAWLAPGVAAGDAGAAGATFPPGSSKAGQALDEALADFEAVSGRELAALPDAIDSVASGLSAGSAGEAAAALAGAPHRPAEPAGLVTQAQVHTPVGQPGFADELVQTASQIAQQVHAAQQGTHEVTLHLHPAEMGPVTVAIEMNGGAARIEFGASQAATREHLQASLPALAEALRADGLTLAHGAVSDQPGADHPSRRPTSGQPGSSGRGGRVERVEPGTGDDGLSGSTSRVTTLLQRRSGGLDLFA